jgi:hypothetical protein
MNDDQPGGPFLIRKSQDSKNLTLDREHRDMEALAGKVAQEFRITCRKLRPLLPKVKRIQDYFAAKVRGSVTLAGCQTFKDFCEKKLGRSPQAVYSMLGDYPARQKAKKQKVPKPGRVYDDGLTQEDVNRLRTAANAVNRAKEAETQGRKAEAEIAWTEYARITEAEPLKSVLAGDIPNYKLMLVDLLFAVEQLLSTLLKIADGVSDPAILAQIRSCAGKGTTMCHAYRRRLGVTDAAMGNA